MTILNWKLKYKTLKYNGNLKEKNRNWVMSLVKTEDKEDRGTDDKDPVQS